MLEDPGDVYGAAAEARTYLMKGMPVCMNVGEDDLRLVLCPSGAWGEPGASLMVALEGGGVYFWEKGDGRPGNVYDLIGAGFFHDYAVAISTLLHYIFNPGSRRSRRRKGRPELATETGT